MTSFPSDWQVFPLKEYAAFNRDSLQDAERGVHVLQKLDNNSRVTSFRLYIFGRGAVEMRVPVEKLLADPGGFAGQEIALSLPVGMVTPEENRVATNWLDLETLIRNRTASLVDSNQKEQATAPLLQFLATQESGKQAQGSSLRWAVGATTGDDPQLQLELHCLPARANIINKSNVKSDSCSVMLLYTEKLNAEMFDGKDVGGPVPLWFSSAPDAASSSLDNHPAAARADIAHTNSHFMVTDNISMEDALNYVKSKKRAQKGTQAFPEKRLKGKKQKTDNPPEESGTVVLFVH
jgi:hypothetical protein